MTSLAQPRPEVVAVDNSAVPVAALRAALNDLPADGLPAPETLHSPNLPAPITPGDVNGGGDGHTMESAAGAERI